MDWFTGNTILIEDYLVPVVSRSGYIGEKLYNHIRSRFTRNNKNLKELAKALDITEMTLTSYVSRHTMAMTLQDNQVPVSTLLVISEAMRVMGFVNRFNMGIKNAQLDLNNNHASPQNNPHQCCRTQCLARISQ